MHRFADPTPNCELQFVNPSCIHLKIATVFNFVAFVARDCKHASTLLNEHTEYSLCNYNDAALFQ